MRRTLYPTAASKGRKRPSRLGREAGPEDADALSRDESPLAALYAASVHGRVATGPRAGQRVTRFSDRIEVEDIAAARGPRCAEVAGVSLHANVAVEREGARVYEELITNSATLAVTVPLRQGGSFLLFLRPDTATPGSYQIVPLRNGCQAASADRIEVDLRRYDLLSEATKALPATEDLRRRRAVNPSAPPYHEEVALKDLPGLIRRIRGDASDSPQLDPQTPEH